MSKCYRLDLYGDNGARNTGNYFPSWRRLRRTLRNLNPVWTAIKVSRVRNPYR